MRALVNTVYALLAEQADANDRAERALVLQADDEDRKAHVTHREWLDDWLVQPVGRQADADAALLRALGG